jgi:hypothetical protein
MQPIKRNKNGGNTKMFIRLLVPQSSAAVYKCGPSSGAGCGTHIYIYRWSMGVINNDATIAPSLDGEKLHVGCCVCLLAIHVLSRRHRERQNVLASNMKIKKMEGDISYIHVCASIMLTNQRAEACVMDGKNYGHPAYAHTQMCVWRWG